MAGLVHAAAPLADIMSIRYLHNMFTYLPTYILLTILNYMHDRVNFKLAYEMKVVNPLLDPFFVIVLT